MYGVSIAIGKGWGFPVITGIGSLVLLGDLLTKEEPIAVACARLENYTPWFMQH